MLRPYHGQGTMIYIDPPYNMGNDFVYPDDFRDPLGNYLRLTDQADAHGNLLTRHCWAGTFRICSRCLFRI
jgi:adenine-specific DNA-methyltransferase